MTPAHRSCVLAPLAGSLLLLAGLLVAAPAGAVTVDDLYRAEVKVADKSHEVRADGFRRALERVLVKVSGSSAVLLNPDAAELLESPRSFVQEFRYERIEDAERGQAAQSQAPAEADGEAPQPYSHYLVVQFAQTRLEQALRGHGILVWRARRPEVLVWLAVDDGEARRIVSADGESLARERLVERARQRGLPMMLPLMDMKDRARVSFVDIQGGFLDAVQSASQRYRPNAVLIGHVHPYGGTWAGSWHLLGVGERKSWDSAGAELGAAVAAGIDGATNRVARAFVGRGEEVRELRLRVLAVDSLDAYARVSQYLSGLLRVRSADVVQLRPSEVVFQISLNGQITDLERAITLGSMLSRVRPSEPDRTRLPAGAAAESPRAATTPMDGDRASVSQPMGEGDPAPAGQEAVDLTFRLVG